MIGYGCIFSFHWSTLSWKQRQKLGKLLIILIKFWPLGAACYRSNAQLLGKGVGLLDRLLQVVGQSSISRYGLALVYLYLQCLISH